MAALTLNIDEIKTANQRFERALTRAWLEGALGGEPPTGFAARGAAELVLTATRLETDVVLRGAFDVALSAPCRRCLKDVAVNAPVRFDLHFKPGKKAESTGSSEDDGESDQSAGFALGAADEETYDGKTIQLESAIREQLLLGLPGSPLCMEDCRGLCAVCGEDRNTVDCGHDQRPPDPRWAALKDLKL